MNKTVMVGISSLAVTLGAFSIAATDATEPTKTRPESGVQAVPAKPDPVEKRNTVPPKTAKFDRARFERDVVKQKDLPNFHEVHPFLYRSGEPTAKGLQMIKDKGIKTVIDLRAPTEKAIAESAMLKEMGIKYINLPMSSAPPTKKQVDTFLSTVKAAQANPENGSVLVHCAHGSDRTGCLVGIWRVTEDKWSYDKAYQEMRHYWFTPKFTKLSGAVREYASKQSAQTGASN